MNTAELKPGRLNPLLDRACPKCDVRMWLAVIEPDEPGRHKLVFDCGGCGHEESVVVRFEQRPPLAGSRASIGGARVDRDRSANALNMPVSFVNNPKHWEERATDMRALAGQMSDGEAKETMLRIAKDYEKLAQRCDRSNPSPQALE